MSGLLLIAEMLGKVADNAQAATTALQATAQAATNANAAFNPSMAKFASGVTDQINTEGGGMSAAGGPGSNELLADLATYLQAQKQKGLSPAAQAEIEASIERITALIKEWTGSFGRDIFSLDKFKEWLQQSGATVTTDSSTGALSLTLPASGSTAPSGGSPQAGTLPAAPGGTGSFGIAGVHAPGLPGLYAPPGAPGVVLEPGGGLTNQPVADAATAQIQDATTTAAQTVTTAVTGAATNLKGSVSEIAAFHRNELKGIAKEYAQQLIDAATEAAQVIVDVLPNNSGTTKPPLSKSSPTLPPVYTGHHALTPSINALMSAGAL